jgi:hypothetical protein
MKPRQILSLKFSYYPKEIKLQKMDEAEVLESRFAGNYYWNKIKAKNKELVMYTDEKLDGMVNISFV